MGGKRRCVPMILGVTQGAPGDFQCTDPQPVCFNPDVVDLTAVNNCSKGSSEP